MNGQLIGYARVSSYGQRLDVQLEKLSAVGCTRIYQEKASAKSNSQRPQLEALLSYVREGDVLHITKLDRLARSVADLTNIVKTLETKGCGLVVLDQQIDTTTPTGRLLLHMLAAIGEFERELIQERATEGREKARARGVRFGVQPKLSNEQIKRLRHEFAAATCDRTELARRYGISRASLYRLCNSTSGDQ